MWAIGAQRAFLESRHKDHSPAAQTDIFHISEETSTETPIPDDAAIGWHHTCETLTDNGAHISEICAAQLWNPTTWSARPDASNSELGRKHLARTQWRAKQARVTSCSQ